jgi:hypothetical protein
MFSIINKNKQVSFNITPPAKEIKKAKEQLFDSAITLWAAFFVVFPFSKMSQTLTAPVGNPEKTPIANGNKKHGGIPRNFDTPKMNLFLSETVIVLHISFVSKIEAKSDGIRVVAHMSSAFFV